MAELPEWYRRPAKVKATPVSVEGLQVRVRVEVDPPIPSPDWTSYFDDPQLPKNIGRKPRVVEEFKMGKTIIEGVCNDAEFEDYVQMIDERIKQANARYEEFDVPQIDAQFQREAEVKEADRQRLEDLKKRAEDL